MRNCTGQITVGSPARGFFGGSDVGIGPRRVLYLVEGSRAAWVLESVVHNFGEGQPASPVTWVASRPERIMADGLRMIAALEFEHPLVRQMIASLSETTVGAEMLSGPHADLTLIDETELARVADVAAEAIPRDAKLIVTPFGGSSITHQLGILERGTFEAEVCVPAWARGAGPDGEVRTAGKLPPEDPGAHRFHEVRI